MKQVDDEKQIKKLFLGKKTKNKKNLFIVNTIEKNKRKIIKDSIYLESSTDLSSSNIINYEEKSDTMTNFPGLDDIVIPSFFNDITKYNDINKKIKNYYKIEKELGSPELAKLYLIDVKRLYEEKKKI